MRERGTGSVIKVQTKLPNGETVESRYWYILYYHNGRKVKESSKSESRVVAEKLLQHRLAESGLGVAPEQNVKGVRYEHIRDAWFAEHKNQGRATYTSAAGTVTVGGLNHLDNYFKGFLVTKINSDTL